METQHKVAPAFAEKFQGPQLETMELEDYSEIERGNRKIIIRPIQQPKPGSNHPRFSFRCYKHPVTGKWRGIPVSKNPNGTYNFQKIVIDGRKVYDLSIEKEAIEYHIVKDFTYMKGSAMGLIAGIEPTFIVFDEDKEAEIFVQKRISAREAEDYIIGLSTEEAQDFGGLFNINPTIHKPMAIKQMLLERCINNPESVVEKMKDQQGTNVWIILRRAMFANIITESLGQGVMYKGTMSLGSSQMDAVEKLRKDPKFLALIDNESKQHIKTGSTKATQQHVNSLPANEVTKVMQEAKKQETLKEEILGKVEVMMDEKIDKLTNIIQQALTPVSLPKMVSTASTDKIHSDDEEKDPFGPATGSEKKTAEEIKVKVKAQPVKRGFAEKKKALRTQ